MFVAGMLWKKARHLLLPAVGMGLAFYFGYFGVYGARGMLAVEQLEARIVTAKEILMLEADKRAAFERRVALLRPTSLDPDLLEERARTLLNMGRSSDFTIVAPEPSSTKKPVRVSSP